MALSACSSGSPAQPPKGPQAEAVFAGGCFWCTEADFDKMPGVLSTTSGYTGGRVANPTYKQVTAGGTGHIEAVRVVYDPRRISYSTLVQRFLRTVDVTDGGGQFCDRGQSYRPAIFVATDEQRRASRAALAEASKQIGKKTEVAVLPAARFWAAEGYHQDYYKKNPARYRFYRWNCGRDKRLKQVWG
ncbi:MAG: peptide-methionine (S)-S-oxide reductase MsrA [Sphingomicrobium sp.]